jgi:hypothetical protein
MQRLTIPTRAEELCIYLEAIAKGRKGFLSRLMGRVICPSKAKVREAAVFAVELLQDLETIPVEFVNGGVCFEKIPYKKIISAIEQLLDELRSYPSGDLSTLSIALERHFFALLYRLERWNREEQPKLAEKIYRAAQEFKSSLSILADKEISPEEAAKIEEASRYRAFATLLLSSPCLQEEFFHWMIRDKNEIEPYILFPAMQHKLTACNMSGRIGRFKEGLLRIVKEKINGTTMRKILALRFEGKYRNILDEEATVSLRGGWSPTIGEVFDTFRNKFRSVGNLEFFESGICNWNCHDWGFWNGRKEELVEIELTKKNWWRQLPSFEVISLKEAQQRYGPHMNGTVWNVAAVSTRDTTTLDYDGCHTFLELAIPRKNGSYALYDFGKFAKEFPTSIFENLKLFCYNLYATVAYPDENVFYSHRQPAYHSFPLTEKEGLALLERIRRDIVLGRAENFIYQIESENCAKWVFTHLQSILGENAMPNLYRTSLLKTEPKGIMAAVFVFIRTLPLFCQIPFLMAMHVPFGAKEVTWIIERGEAVPKALHLADFWNTGEVFLPAYLHRKQELGHLPRVGEIPTYASVSLRFTAPSVSSLLKAATLLLVNILQERAQIFTLVASSSSGLLHKLFSFLRTTVSSVVSSPSIPSASIKFPSPQLCFKLSS